MNLLGKVTILLVALTAMVPAHGACREKLLIRLDTVTGKLSAEDCTLQDLVGGRDGSKVDVFVYKVDKVDSINISLSSNQFDSYLHIYSEDYTTLYAAEDNSKNGPNVSIDRLILNPGTYKVLVNSATHDADYGRYVLRMSEPAYSGDVPEETKAYYRNAYRELAANPANKAVSATNASTTIKETEVQAQE
ncbi:MAG: PPC domain-containing protein [bacterium]|nr:hypothetical protein [Gammaproteobacteria bacterium]HIL99170.1 hypothetical protein [Pseudomonadales bacterium]